MEYYLGPICKIMAFSMKGHEFRLVLKLADRETFESYYEKEKKRKDSFLLTPESTYIFSQEMSNLQVSLVKHFNHKFNRSGTLMAGRFKRKEIMDSTEVMDLVRDLNKGEGHHSYSRMWVNDLMKGCKAMTSEWLYGGEFDSNIGVYLRVKECDLVGQINHPIENLVILPHCIHSRRSFAAICRYLE
jgi:hypothetical protein